jgi:molecular chaperone DnaJ
VRQRTQTIFGTMEQETACPSCEGRGKTISKKCHACRGRGLEDIKVEKPVDIPAGIDDGMSMKISGEGDEVPDGATGDLYIHIEVGEPPAGLEREDVNLRYRLELHPVELVLGIRKSVKIPVVGERTIDLAAGTQVGTVLRFTGDGVPSLQRERRGDLFVEIAVKIPEKLSKKERELYAKIAEEAKIEPRSGGILSKLFE